MSLSSAPLSPTLRALLTSHGFVSASQVRQLSPSQLAAELGMDLLEALALLNALKPTPPHNHHQYSHHQPHRTQPSPAAAASSAALSSPSPPPAPPPLHAAIASVPPPPRSLFPSALSLFARRCGLQTENRGVGGGGGEGEEDGGGAAGGLSAASAAGVVSGVSASVFTLCQRLDGLLGDGVQLGELTEFCGAPGLGKTQLAVQLAVATSIPSSLGGVEGEAVYIDTEGSFVASRARDIAQGLQGHLDKLNRKRGSAAADASSPPHPRPSVESMLRGIHVFRVFDVVEQLSVVRHLPHFLSSHPRVRLLVIDSIAFHFRRGFEGDFSSRARLLANLAQQLLALAAKHRLAVVAINQVTTRIGGGGGGGGEAGIAADGGVGAGGVQQLSVGSGGGGGGVAGSDASASLAPALGESWSHSCTSRVLLFWKGTERWARIIKSPSRKQAACRYTITRDGIRDVKAAHNMNTTLTATAPQQQQQLQPHAQRGVERPSHPTPTALLHTAPSLDPPAAKRLAVAAFNTDPQTHQQQSP